jgi:hypothetical protein
LGLAAVGAVGDRPTLLRKKQSSFGDDLYRFFAPRPEDNDRCQIGTHLGTEMISARPSARF